MEFDLPLIVPRLTVKYGLITEEHEVYKKYVDAWKGIVEQTRDYARKNGLFRDMQENELSLDLIAAKLLNSD